MNERVLILANDAVRSNAILVMRGLPVDGSMELAIRPVSKRRSLSQNARQWVDILAQISAQAWVEGKQFSPEVWHEHFKKKLLPEPDALLTRPDYRKWAEMPDGTLKCVGSTTKLTKRGFSEYMTAVEADAANELGVTFYVREL